jgi:hypothetical protein
VWVYATLVSDSKSLDGKTDQYPTNHTYHDRELSEDQLVIEEDEPPSDTHSYTGGKPDRHYHGKEQYCH